MKLYYFVTLGFRIKQMEILLGISKAITYDEWPKMKRDTQQNRSPFPKRKTNFLSGISLHFLPFVVCYGFRKFFPPLHLFFAYEIPKTNTYHLLNYVHAYSEVPLYSEL